jgi:hypothetical protein
VSDGILDLADHALDDWATEPPRVICDEGQPLWPERWNWLRHGTWSYIVTAVGPDGQPIPGAIVEIRPSHFHPGDYISPRAGRRDWRRCPLCHPQGNPPKLPVDGREYRRRQMARRRRRR